MIAMLMRKSNSWLVRGRWEGRGNDESDDTFLFFTGIRGVQDGACIPGVQFLRAEKPRWTQSPSFGLAKPQVQIQRAEYSITFPSGFFSDSILLPIPF